MAYGLALEEDWYTCTLFVCLFLANWYIFVKALRQPWQNLIVRLRSIRAAFATV